ncbi:hypothetical protein HS088_TW13G00141 [Tripterygium wilfordii]|uniref:Uncharacterized protein n=1 Tax=Tripterygium wilfordii TaxID=458696 RepID=A0A7J7CT26_TRIWF|nr:hypothetical protein HS088_TW13G00141 [Tripterygium wilfordii]
MFVAGSQPMNALALFLMDSSVGFQTLDMLCTLWFHLVPVIMFLFFFSIYDVGFLYQLLHCYVVAGWEIIGLPAFGCLVLGLAKKYLSSQLCISKTRSLVI